MMSARYRSAGRVLLLLALCLALTGCGSKRVTKANFDKITDRMPRTDVEMILGKGEEEAEGGISPVGTAAGIAVGDVTSRPASGVKWVKWGDDKKWIKIGFRGDLVEPGTKQQQGL